MTAVEIFQAVGINGILALIIYEQVKKKRNGNNGTGKRRSYDVEFTTMTNAIERTSDNIDKLASQMHRRFDRIEDKIDG